MQLDDPSRSRMVTWQNPQNSAEAAKQMSGLDFLQTIARGELPAPPLGKLLNLYLKEAENGRVVFVCTPAEYHYNPIGSVHGGLVATLLDSAASCAVQSKLPAGKGYTTIELHVNYIRPITADTGELRCIGKAIHVGRRLGTAEAQVINADGKLYAHATATCMIF